MLHWISYMAGVNSLFSIQSVPLSALSLPQRLLFSQHIMPQWLQEGAPNGQCSVIAQRAGPRNPTRRARVSCSDQDVTRSRTARLEKNWRGVKHTGQDRLMSSDTLHVFKPWVGHQVENGTIITLAYTFLPLSPIGLHC